MMRAFHDSSKTMLELSKICKFIYQIKTYYFSDPYKKSENMKHFWNGNIIFNLHFEKFMTPSLPVK